MVSGWAGNFAAQLNDTSRKIYYLRMCLEKKIGDIARVLGKKSVGTIGYHIDDILEKCHFFVRDLPWLSKEEFNPKAFSFFLISMCALLKKMDPAP